MKNGLLALLMLVLFCGSCYGQDESRYGDSQMVYLMREIDILRGHSEKIQDCLAETREEIAEMRGRQSVTTGIAAGTPTGLAALLFWWLKRRPQDRVSPREPSED